MLQIVIVNPLKISPEYSHAKVYGKCMLQLKQIVLNGLSMWANQARGHLMQASPHLLEGAADFTALLRRQLVVVGAVARRQNVDVLAAELLHALP